MTAAKLSESTPCPRRAILVPAGADPDAVSSQAGLWQAQEGSNLTLLVADRAATGLIRHMAAGTGPYAALGLWWRETEAVLSRFRRNRDLVVVLCSDQLPADDEALCKALMPRFGPLRLLSPVPAAPVPLPAGQGERMLFELSARLLLAADTAAQRLDLVLEAAAVPLDEADTAGPEAAPDAARAAIETVFDSLRRQLRAPPNTAELRELRQQLDEKAAAVDELLQLETELAGMDCLREQLDATLHVAEERHAACEAAQTRVALLEASRSWRWTRPMRAVGRLARKLR